MGTAVYSLYGCLLILDFTALQINILKKLKKALTTRVSYGKLPT